jgi:hypothetical protein
MVFLPKIWQEGLCIQSPWYFKAGLALSFATQSFDGVLD